MATDPKLAVRFFRTQLGNEPVREWLKSLIDMARRRLVARKKTGNPHVGSDFESFLVEDGQLEATTAVAIKRVLAWQIAAAMKDANVSQAELARRMRTSRAVVHRLLDADDPSITLSTISRAASALGKSVRVQLAGT